MIIYNRHYSRAFSRSGPASTPSLLPVCSSHHSCRTRTSFLTSSTVLPACKQILTLCVPCGTVGGTTARIIIPFIWRYRDRSLGCCSCTAKMGDCGQALGMRNRLCTAAEVMCKFLIASNRTSVRLCRCDCKVTVPPVQSNSYDDRMSARDG